MKRGRFSEEQIIDYCGTAGAGGEGTRAKGLPQDGVGLATFYK